MSGLVFAVRTGNDKLDKETRELMYSIRDDIDDNKLHKQNHHHL
jgi:hypothetical protein